MPPTPPESPAQVTHLLHAIQRGETHAAGDLLPLVYDELRRLAGHKLAHEAPGQTLQPTALVHEAWLRLVDVDVQQRWDSRGHFFAAAAEAMRRILVESARRKQRLKHGGEFQRVDLQEADLPIEPPDSGFDLLALDAALVDFAAEAPEKAELVKLRYFAGLSEQAAADVLGISRATAARHWAYAKAWLLDRIRGA
jgi:RNA polymerase sigma factor (TIGR02999 family)